MKSKINALLDSKKFIISIILINCILIMVSVGYIVFSRMAKTELPEPMSSSRKEISYNDKDSELVGIYMSLIEGYDFDLGDNIHFVFGMDGTYSGFFDADNQSVSNYEYSVSIDGDEVMLNIYNKKKTKQVSYNMTFDKKGNIILKHPSMKKSIKLNF